MAVMPMIGIQFSVYELMKRLLLQQPIPIPKRTSHVSPTSAPAPSPVGSSPTSSSSSTADVEDKDPISKIAATEFDLLNPTITADIEEVLLETETATETPNEVNDGTSEEIKKSL